MNKVTKGIVLAGGAGSSLYPLPLVTSKQPQGKLLRVISGEVYNVAVDIRKISPTFGKWV